jgi:hypothetical protein
MECNKKDYPGKAKLNELYGKKFMKKGHAPGFPGA